MKVMNIKGDVIGFVKDIMIDYAEGKVMGFKISCNKIFSKDCNILVKDVIYMNENIIVEKTSKEEFLSFKDLRHMDILDKEGNIIGILEDILINPSDFSIKAIIVCPGFIYKLFGSKNIILIKDTILGDENILCVSDFDNMSFRSMPRKLFKR